MKKKEVAQLTNKLGKDMILTLGDKVMKCVDTQESTYGLRYVFESGTSWTESNIISNIDLCQSKGQQWNITKGEN